MITLEQIKTLNPTAIVAGKKYSQVLPNPIEGYYSLRSKSGKEYIYAPGNPSGIVFYHYNGNGKEIFIKEIVQDFDLLIALLKN